MTMNLPLETAAKRASKKVFELRQVVWRFREVDGAPMNLSREDLIVRRPDDAFTKFRFLFDGLTTERFVVFILDAKNMVQAVDIVSEGTLNSSLVHPREAYRSAILGAGAAIIVAHNHPSGNPEPSREDIEITNQLKEAGKIIGIPLHDHIIFAGNSYTSFAERGLL